MMDMLNSARNETGPWNRPSPLKELSTFAEYTPFQEGSSEISLVHND